MKRSNGHHYRVEDYVEELGYDYGVVVGDYSYYNAIRVDMDGHILQPLVKAKIPIGPGADGDIGLLRDLVIVEK